MGIVRLAKSLKILKSITEIDNRREDVAKKIPGTRVYTDFVSIVYKVQLDVSKQINYVLYSLLLLSQNMLNSTTYNKLYRYLEMYSDIFVDYPVDMIKKIIKSKNNGNLTINKILEIEIDEDVVISHVYSHVIHFIADMCGRKVSDVNYILIAFDGIPSYGKIQEQRQRRYMRKAQTFFQKSILSRSITDPKKLIKKNKVEGETNTIKVLNIRKIFDSKRVMINIRKAIDIVYSSYENGTLREDIEEGTKEIKNKILSKKNRVNDEINIQCEIIEEKYGEGEKILVDRMVQDIESMGDSEKYVFYSPDGDSVLLCLDAYSKVAIKPTFLNVIKMYELEPRRQHNHKSQYVDIKVFYSNLVKIVYKYSGMKMNSLDGDMIATDYVIFMSLFGNDFIHQHPSTEIGNCTLDIIYIYSQFVRDHGYIHERDESNLNGIGKVLFSNNFIEFLRVLAENENMLMLDSMLNNAMNARDIVKSFGDIFPHAKLVEYNSIVMPMKRKLFSNIMKLDESNRHEIKNMLNNMMGNMDDYVVTIMKDGESYEQSILQIFRKLEVRDMNDYVQNLIKDPTSLTSEYKVKFRKNKNEKELSNAIIHITNPIYKKNEVVNHISGKYRRYEFEYETILDMSNVHPQMPITGEDIDMYLLEWRGGDWKYLLHSTSFFEGIKANDLYEDVSMIVNQYNTEVLHIDDNNDINAIVESYLKSFSWIKDYYCNSNIIENPEVISTWSYVYEKSPMFYSIIDYIDSISQDDFNLMINSVYEDSLVNVADYLDDNIHKLYIYPLDYPTDYNIYNETYKIEENINAFPDIKSYVKITLDRLVDIRKNKSIDDDIDVQFNCSDVPYFSKCVFKNEMLTYDELVDINRENKN